MIPESIRAEIEGKGGLAGPPEPQGNGTTIYRALSGDYIVVNDATGRPAMRGFAPPAEGAPMASPQPSAAPAAPVATSGSGYMTQQQLEDLLKQIAPNGDPRRLEPYSGMRKKTVTTGSGILATTETVEVPYVGWVDRATGRTLEADVETGGGSYTVTFNGVKEANQGKPAVTAQEQQASQPQTGEIKKPVEGRPGWTQITRSASQNGNKTETTVYVGPDGKEVPTLPAETKTDRKPVTGQPGVYLVTTTNGTKSETHFENETGQTIQAPPNLPATIVANGITYVKGADGNYAPAPGIPQPGATAKNVDPFTPDFADPAADLGLGKWAAKQRAKIGLPAEQGGITQKEYDDAVTAAHASATTSISNITANTSVTRQQAIDEETRRQQQRSEAASDFTAAQGRFNERWQYMNPDKPGIGSYISTTAEELARARKDREGNARPMPALHPMFTGGVGAAPAVAAPAPSTPTPPNAIGLGGPGAMFSPSGGPALPSAAVPAPAPAVTASAVAAPAPAATPRVLALPAAEPYAPPPLDNVPMPTEAAPRVLAMPTPEQTPTAATPPTPPVSPPIQGNPVGAPGQTVFPVMAPGDRSGLPATMPLPGETTALPTPENVAPAAPEPMVTIRNKVTGATDRIPRSKWERSWTLGIWEEVPDDAPAPAAPTSPLPSGEVTMAPPNPALTSVAQRAQQPVFNPYDTAGRMVGLGIPSEAVAQALAEMGLAG